jgi:hypothetical protein
MRLIDLQSSFVRKNRSLVLPNVLLWRIPKHTYSQRKIFENQRIALRIRKGEKKEERKKEKGKRKKRNAFK